jgi:plastocyanin
MLKSFTSCAVAVLVVGACGESPPAPVPPLDITTAPLLPAATLGAAYELTFTTAGATGPVQWSVSAGALPVGLTLSSGGQLSGTPTAVEQRQFTVRAVSGRQQTAASFTLGVNAPPLVVVTATLANAVLGASYSQVLQATGGTEGDGPAAWSLATGALPPGLTLTASGIVAGNPSSLGLYPFVVRVTRGSQSAERSLGIHVDPPPLVITTASLPLAKVGVAYMVRLESTGGVGGNTWSLTSGRLPGGLTLSAAGLLTGTPTLPESTSFNVEVSSGAQRATRTLSLWVDPAGFPATALVTMPGNVFVPFLVQIQRGGSVTWRFGAEPHNVIFVVTAGAPADINIVSNVDVSRRFDVLGTFRYDCTIHPGMSGIVEVKP